MTVVSSIRLLVVSRYPPDSCFPWPPYSKTTHNRPGERERAPAVVRRRRNTPLLQRAPHHASAAVAASMAGPGWRNRDRGEGSATQVMLASKR